MKDVYKRQEKIHEQQADLVQSQQRDRGDDVAKVRRLIEQEPFREVVRHLRARGQLAETPDKPRPEQRSLMKPVAPFLLHRLQLLASNRENPILLAPGSTVTRPST